MLKSPFLFYTLLEVSRSATPSALGNWKISVPRSGSRWRYSSCVYQERPSSPPQGVAHPDRTLACIFYGHVPPIWFSTSVSSPVLPLAHSSSVSQTPLKRRFAAGHEKGIGCYLAMQNICTQYNSAASLPGMPRGKCCTCVPGVIRRKLLAAQIMVLFSIIKNSFLNRID